MLRLIDAMLISLLQGPQREDPVQTDAIHARRRQELTRRRQLQARTVSRLFD